MMKGSYVFRVSFKYFFELISSGKGRTFLNLCWKIGDRKRYKSGSVRLGKHNFWYADNWSFLWQYFEIFYKKYYCFETDNKHPVIFDCGANIGLASYFFLQMYPNCQLYAYEPDPQIAEIYKRNILETDNVSFCQKAVWVHNKGIKMIQEGADGGFVSQTEGNLFVETTSLKDELRKHQQIDLLKIDIEGAENEVLADCADELYRVKNLFLEYHSYNKDKQKFSEILKILEKENFRYYITNEYYYLYQPMQENRSRMDRGTFDLQLNIFAVREY